MRYLILILLFSCSQIKKEKRFYRHGIVPLSGIELKRDQESIKRGQALYQKHCMDCHGQEGRGDGVMAQDNDLNPANLRELVKRVNNFDFFMEVSKSKEQMPGWAQPLDRDQRRDLSHYIQTFLD